MRLLICFALLALAVGKDCGCKCCRDGQLVTIEDRCNPRLGYLPPVLGRCSTMPLVQTSELLTPGEIAILDAEIEEAIATQTHGFGSSASTSTCTVTFAGSGTLVNINSVLGLIFNYIYIPPLSENSCDFIYDPTTGTLIIPPGLDVTISGTITLLGSSGTCRSSSGLFFPPIYVAVYVEQTSPTRPDFSPTTLLGEIENIGQVITFQETRSSTLFSDDIMGTIFQLVVTTCSISDVSLLADITYTVKPA